MPREEEIRTSRAVPVGAPACTAPKETAPRGARESGLVAPARAPGRAASGNRTTPRGKGGERDGWIIPDRRQPGGSEWLTVEEVCAELKISSRTFYRWRAQGTGPRSKRIAGGGVRVRRNWLDDWLDEPEQDIA